MEITSPGRLCWRELAHESAECRDGELGNLAQAFQYAQLCVAEEMELESLTAYITFLESLL
jgi:hypothetical protein